MSDANNPDGLPDARVVERVEAFAKGPMTTLEEHDDIMVAVRLARQAIIHPALNTAALPEVLDNAFNLIGRTIKCMAEDLVFVANKMPNEDQVRYYALQNDLREALPQIGAAIDQATATPPASTSTAIAAGEIVAWLRKRAADFRHNAAFQKKRPGPRASGFEDAATEIEQHFAAAPKAASKDGATGLQSADAEALAGYRAAASFIAADAWDGCSDCIAVLRAARAADWQNDQAADPNETARQLARIRLHDPAIAASPTDATGKG